MTTTEQFNQTFNLDIAEHTITVVRDEGVNRILRFQRPGTSCMLFDILTWPGYLCYTGDMGTYVFRRENDMLGFFRKGRNDKPYRIDHRYWAEKVEAADKYDGIDQFSFETFKANVKDYFDQYVDEDWTDERKKSLWDEIDSEVLDENMSEGVLAQRLYEFEHDGFRFQDWERSSKEYSHRFLWCCNALEWAIKTYDDYKEAQKNVPAQEQLEVNDAPAVEVPRP